VTRVGRSLITHHHDGKLYLDDHLVPCPAWRLVSNFSLRADVNGKSVTTMKIIDRVANFLLGWFLLIFGRAASRLLLNLRVEGVENVPTTGPLIVISNHFSWFDAPLLTLYLPFQPAFLVASESQRFWFVRLFMRAFHGIPIWRGRVDRDALSSALSTLRSGKVVGIFPEGGIDPRFAERRARGEAITNQGNNNYGFVSRDDAQLTYPEPGTAFLALQSQARILPVALLGTEKILGNVLRLRRTDVIVRIGPTFGPLSVEAKAQGVDRRQRLNHTAELIMHRIAALFPPENRGPYRNVHLETT
jgi:1-acyl-sn-glycerol-3-phosphate acyltransferase